MAYSWSEVQPSFACSFDGDWEDDDGTVAADPVADPSRPKWSRASLEVTIKKGEMRGADGIQIEAGYGRLWQVMAGYGRLAHQRRRS